jgi:hypothetical protein
MCGIEENLRRLTSPDRAQRGKMTDVHLAEQMLKTAKLYEATEPTQMGLDVTYSDASDAARCIFKHVMNILEDKCR